MMLNFAVLMFVIVNIMAPQKCLLHSL